MLPFSPTTRRGLAPLLLWGVALTPLLFCAAPCGAGGAPPADFDVPGALRQAERYLAAALAECGGGAAARAEGTTSRGLYAATGEDGRLAAFEVRFGGRDYHFKMRRDEQGGGWSIAGAPSPDPCGGETLALTMDDVDAYNRIPGLPWAAAMPERVQGRTVEQLRRGLSAVGAKERQAAVPLLVNGGAAARRALPALVDTVGGVRLPAEYDARERYSTEYPCQAFRVRDQGANGCGSCSALAFTTAAAARLCLQRGRDPRHNVVLSPQQLMEAANGRDVCEGADLLALARMYGEPRWKEEHCYPYAANFTNVAGRECPRGRNFSAGEPWALPGGNEALMRAELLAGGPMTVAIVARASFLAYNGTGVYVDVPDSPVLGGHAMVLVGWGTDEASGLPYWLLQNSHGADGALGGFARIARGVNMADIEARSVFAFTPAPSPQECPGTECPTGTTLFADCTCSAVPAQPAPPAVNASDDALNAPRIEANRAAAAALRALDAAPAFITYNNRTLGETLWLSGTPARICFRAPRLRVDTRQTTTLAFESAMRHDIFFGLQDLPSVASPPTPLEGTAPVEACGTATLGAGMDRFANWGTMWRLATRPALYMATPYFRVQALTLTLATMVPWRNGRGANLTLTWLWATPGARLPGDELRLVSRNGNFSYPIPMTTPIAPDRPWTGRVALSIPPKTSNGNGPYRAQLFRAADPTTPVFSHPVVSLPDIFWTQYWL